MAELFEEFFEGQNIKKFDKTYIQFFQHLRDSYTSEERAIYDEDSLERRPRNKAIKNIGKTREKKKLDMHNREILQKQRFDFQNCKTKNADDVKAREQISGDTCPKMKISSTLEQGNKVKERAIKYLNKTKKNLKQASRPLKPVNYPNATNKKGFSKASQAEEAKGEIYHDQSFNHLLVKGFSTRNAEIDEEMTHDWSLDKEPEYRCHDYDRYVSALYSNTTKIGDGIIRDKLYHHKDVIGTGDGNDPPTGNCCQRGLYSKNGPPDNNENQNKTRVDDVGAVDGNGEQNQPSKLCNAGDDPILTRDNNISYENDINENKMKSTANRRKSHGGEISRSRNENHPDQTLSEAIAWDYEHKVAMEPEPDFDSDYDFDAEVEVQSDAGDLSTFDFEHMTKEPHPLDANQMTYAAVCYQHHLQPVGYILRNLRTSELRLNSMSLGPRRIKMLCAALISNNYVRTLEISQDVISCQAMTYLVETFGENELIDQLFLRDNNMGRAPTKILLEFLVYTDQFTNISLSGNHLKDDVGVMVAFYIYGSLNLVALDLSCNEFGIDTAEALNRALSKNTSVHTLSLRWNHMNGKAVDTFLKCLLKNRSLVNLDISWNGFEMETVNTLCKVLRANTSLNTLDISSCRLTGEALMEIGAALKKNTTLKHLSMANNLFSCPSVSDFTLELLKHKGQLGLKEVDFQEMPVVRSTKETVVKLMMEKDVMVLHGPILGRYEREETDEDILLTINPTIILKEFGHLLGMDLTSLFEYMDDDGSGALSRDEIKEGLLLFNIPLPEMSLDLLIRQLDRTGDDEISLQEFLVCDSQGYRARIYDILYNREKQATEGQTNSMRCRKILRRMMIEQEKKKSLLDLTLAEEQNDNCKTCQGPHGREAFKLPNIQDNNKVTG